MATVQALIEVADKNEPAITMVLEELGFAEVEQCCIDELLDRLEPIEITTEVSLHLKLDWHEESADYGLTIGNYTLTQSYGEPSQAIARLQFTLVDLVRLLFGPPHVREAANPESAVNSQV